MKFTDTKSLAEYRLDINRNNSEGLLGEGGTDVELYGVYDHLNCPVIKFTRLSKKYLYDEGGNKHPYINNFHGVAMPNGLNVYTSQSEAWSEFKHKLHLREEALRLHYEIESNDLKRANEFVLEHMEHHPEHFV